VAGELRKGDRPSGEEIAEHLESVAASLPGSCRGCTRGGLGVLLEQAVEAYEKRDGGS